MLLSDTDLRVKLREQTDVEYRIVIDPLNQHDIQPASIDLHLGAKILIDTGRSLGKYPDPNGWIHWSLIEDGPLHIEPGDFVLAPTFEWIEIPPTLAGQMIGKSSRAREGWVIESAGFFDPGWAGRGTMEISMRRGRGGLLTYEMPICQMRFFALTSQPTFLYGQKELGSHYNMATEAQPSFRERSD